MVQDSLEPPKKQEKPDPGSSAAPSEKPKPEDPATEEPVDPTKAQDVKDVC
jgi:hypothetical protein